MYSELPTEGNHVTFKVFLITTWAVILSNDPKSLGWFALHPPLQSLGLSLFTYGA